MLGAGVKWSAVIVEKWCGFYSFYFYHLLYTLIVFLTMLGTDILQDFGYFT